VSKTFFSSRIDQKIIFYGLLVFFVYGWTGWSIPVTNAQGMDSFHAPKDEWQRDQKTVERDRVNAGSSRIQETTRDDTQRLDMYDRSHPNVWIDQVLQTEIQSLDLSDLERSFQEVRQSYQHYLPALRHTIVQDAVKDPQSFFSWSRLAKALWQYIFDEIRTLFGLLGTILLLSLFAVLLQQIQNAFEEKNVSRIAQYITFTVLAVLVLNSFYMTAQAARETIDTLTHFMLALFPVLLTLIAAGGALGTIGFFHPFVLFLVNASVVLVDKIVFPLFFLAAFLLLISLFTEYYQLSRLGILMRRVGVAVLSIFFTIFLGVLSVQGTVVSVTDGVTLRTAKYIVSNVIPVFGRMFSDATETVMGASLLVKNAVGLFGILMLLIIAIFPAAKVLVVAFVYQFASAVLQPLGDNPVTASLEVIGQGLMYIFITLVTVSLMFYLTLLILLMASNSVVMYR